MRSTGSQRGGCASATKPSWFHDSRALAPATRIAAFQQERKRTYLEHGPARAQPVMPGELPSDDMTARRRGGPRKTDLMESDQPAAKSSPTRLNRVPGLMWVLHAGLALGRSFK